MKPLANEPPWPFEFVTDTLTLPAVPAGVVAVMDVALATTTFVAALAPKVTLAPVAKFVPVSVTAVPPAVGPLFGLTLEMVGALVVVELP